MKMRTLRLIIAVLAFGGAALAPHFAKFAFAGGPTDSGWCGHVGNDSFCVDGKATWDGQKVYQSQAAIPYLVGPGSYGYENHQCGQYYSSDAHTVDNVQNYIVFWCNYYVYPQNIYLYPRAWVSKSGGANGYNG